MATTTFNTPFPLDATPIASAMSCWRAPEAARELENVTALAGRCAG
jgi:hypothetical protein